MKIPLKEDRSSKTPRDVWQYVGFMAFGMVMGILGFLIGEYRWQYNHSRDIQSLTEHVINAKAELEAGNRNGCADELARITSDFQKLY